MRDIQSAWSRRELWASYDRLAATLVPPDGTLEGEAIHRYRISVDDDAFVTSEFGNEARFGVGGVEFDGSSMWHVEPGRRHRYTLVSGGGTTAEAVRVAGVRDVLRSPKVGQSSSHYRITEHDLPCDVEILMRREEDSSGPASLLAKAASLRYGALLPAAVIKASHHVSAGGESRFEGEVEFDVRIRQPTLMLAVWLFAGSWNEHPPTS